MESGSSKSQSSIVLTALSLVVVLAGVAAVARAGTEQALIAKQGWLVMIGLALFVAPISTVKIPGIKADVVLGDMVTFACAVLFGASAGILAAVVDGALTSLRITKTLEKALYNSATCAISMAGANFATRAVFNDFGRAGVRPPVGYMAGAIALFTLCYFIVQTILIAAYIAASSSQPILKLWMDKFLWTIMGYGASGVTALASFVLVDRIGYLVFLVSAFVMVLAAVFYRSYFRRAAPAALTETV